MTIVQSVERALTVLDALSMEKEGMSIKELSDKLNLPKSTIHRLLLTLNTEGLLGKIERQDTIYLERRSFLWLLMFSIPLICERLRVLSWNSCQVARMRSFIFALGTRIKSSISIRSRAIRRLR